MLDRLFALWDRLERLPLLVRAPIYGATILWAMIGLRGGVIGIPIIIALIAVTSHSPVADLLRVAALFGFATLGGVLAGLSYALIGRWLRRLPFGSYSAGIVTIAPYIAAVVVVVRLKDEEPLFRPPDHADLFVFALCTLIFGLVLGHGLFKDS